MRFFRRRLLCPLVFPLVLVVPAVAPVISFLPPLLALGATVRLNPGLGALVGVVIRLWMGALVVGRIVGTGVALAALAAAALPNCMHPRHPSLAMAIPIPILMTASVGSGVGLRVVS